MLKIIDKLKSKYIAEAAIIVYKDRMNYYLEMHPILDDKLGGQIGGQGCAVMFGKIIWRFTEKYAECVLVLL